ncbi:unnamed protein product [Clavelina lepadiformis]|uniref:Uncharacterized protein n=1 Tax=Clavelina lepadiformis TaxID=159417 RepID=A0ABP0G9Z8_CLALP
MHNDVTVYNRCTICKGASRGALCFLAFSGNNAASTPQQSRDRLLTTRLGRYSSDVTCANTGNCCFVNCPCRLQAPVKQRLFWGGTPIAVRPYRMKWKKAQNIFSIFSWII